MTSPVKGHNKGPIGPLDPDEPPPREPGIKREDEIDPHYAVTLLRSMGVEVSVKDLEYWHASNEGPMYRQMYEPPKLYRWGDVLDWAARTPPVPKLKRKEATEYIRSLGYPITPHTLSQLMYLSRGPRLPYELRGRDPYYAPEDCKKWVEEMKAWGPRHSTAPKFSKPRNAQRRCPKDYADCPNVKHEKCAKYARALCNFTHLQDRPSDPKLLKNHAAQATGVLTAPWAGGSIYSFRKQRLPRLFQWPARRPDKDAKAAYLAAWK